MNLKVEFLGEIEVIFEMALGNESGDQVGSIHKKTKGGKSRETIPLTMFIDPLLAEEATSVGIFRIVSAFLIHKYVL